LKGFGASANYTLISTSGDFGGTTSRSTNEVPGFIPRTGNATLSWRYRKFSTRVLYNFTGSHITAFTAATPGRNLYRFDYASVNAGIAYQIRPDVQLTLDAANLTNEPQAFYRSVRSQMQNTIINGTTLTFGVNGRF
jgi:outer membrane receptor protein involved in Fe transport